MTDTCRAAQFPLPAGALPHEAHLEERIRELETKLLIATTELDRREGP